MAFAEFDGAAGIQKFLSRDQAFEFSADVDDYSRVGNGDDVAVKNFAFGNDGLRGVKLLHDLVHRLVGLAGFGGRVAGYGRCDLRRGGLVDSNRGSFDGAGRGDRFVGYRS